MKPVVIIYDKKSAISLKAKHKAKLENPRATVVEVSNKKAVSKALKGNGNVVHNFAKKLDKRHLKGDDVKTPEPNKEEVPKENKEEALDKEPAMGIVSDKKEEASKKDVKSKKAPAKNKNKK